MIDLENIIRNHLKSLPHEDIANSVYLYGIDFDTESIDIIFDRIISLYENVQILRNIIDNDFKSQSAFKVLLPQSSSTQTIIIRDCSNKEEALSKIIANTTVYEELAKRIRNQEIKYGRPRN